MDPPPRSFAAEAYDCFMVGISRSTEYKLVAHSIAHNGRLPSDHQSCPRPGYRQRAIVLAPAKDKPSAALKKRRP
jgi:hypothetical protein